MLQPCERQTAFQESEFCSKGSHPSVFPDYEIPERIDMPRFKIIEPKQDNHIDQPWASPQPGAPAAEYRRSTVESPPGL